jgi:hypothetical protein
MALIGLNKMGHLIKLGKKKNLLGQNDQWFFNQITYPVLINRPN